MENCKIKRKWLVKGKVTEYREKEKEKGCFRSQKKQHVSGGGRFNFRRGR
jgi:hypothetical protein